MRAHTRLVTITAAAAAVLVGAAPARAVAPAPTLWQRTDVLPVTAPVAVGGHVVTYIEYAGHLSITGLDPNTGVTDWAVPATFSDGTPGETKYVAHAGNTVYYLAPAGDAPDGQAQLSALDARTGGVEWQGPTPETYLDPPDVCRTNRPVLCLDVLEGTSPVAVRINGSTGAETRIPAAGGRAIGPQLIDTEARPNEVMERVAPVSGKVLWRLPLTTLSPSTPVSTDNGWNWQLVGGVYVGWDGTKASPFSITHQLTFGVQASDGKVLWRRAGWFNCLTAETALTAGTLYGCTGTGVITYQRGHVKVSGVHVTLQGINIRTGKTTWTRPVGAVAGALLQTTPASVIGLGKIAVPVTAHHPLGVDLHNGHVVPVPRPTARTAVVWCSQRAFWTPADRTGYADVTTPRFGLVRPCTPTGATARTTTTMDTTVGAHLGHVFVWAQKDGLHAIRR